MSSLFPALPSDQYHSLWSKCIELSSIETQELRYLQNLSSVADDYSNLSAHHAFRSPWVLSSPRDKTKMDFFFAANRPEDNPPIPCPSRELNFFVSTIYSERRNLILHFASDERVVANSWSLILNSCDLTITYFISSVIIPGFFGYFLGKRNMEDFIESIGSTFDLFTHDPEPFLINFDDSFLCCVLRQFFFSPLVRQYVGEQFTIFFDFLSCMKSREPVTYQRLQRFFQFFLTELRGPIPNCPFLRSLFERISRSFENKSQVIMTVIIYAVLANMMLYPTCYAVLPLTSNYIEETETTVQKIKFYCASVSHLPIPEKLANFPPLQGHEITEFSLVEEIVEQILRPAALDEQLPEIETVTLPFVAVQFLAKFEGNEEGLNSCQAIETSSLNQLITFSGGKRESEDLGRNRELDLIVEFLNNVHPDANIPLSPRCHAIREFLLNRNVDSSEVYEIVAERRAAKHERMLVLAEQMAALERAISGLKNAISAVESQFANSIANELFQDQNISTELERRMRKDSHVFCNFVVSHVDAFAQAKVWIKPFVPMVARRFHAILMQNFPLVVMSEDAKHQRIDKLFLERKMKLLGSLEKTGMDASVERIIRSKNIFSHAQDAALRACLLENPVESAKQIVQSVSVVEDLFISLYGCPPEANQFMPLLAHLFILSPMPTPLTFGRWLSHFFQPLMQERPEWFADDTLRPLEHYFQFNEWMLKMLDTVSHSESLDTLRKT